MLTVDSVVPYLIERGHLTAADVVERGVEAADLARRNLNLRVALLDGSRGWVVKQPDPADPGTQVTLEREAEFYAACAGGPLRAHVPARAGYADRALVLGWIDGADPLRARYAAEPEVLAALGGAVGRALAAIHDPAIAQGAWFAGLPGGPPWVLDLHRPIPGMLARLSMANMELIRILQRSEPTCRALDALRTSWSPAIVQHGDLKSDNVLVGRSAPWQVAVIDWELVQRGEAAWDVGAILHDVLLAWIQSMPVARGAADDYVAKAALPLAATRPFVHGLWDGYSAARPGLPAGFLARAVACAAGRLLQTAYEATNRVPLIDNHCVALIQLAINLLADPAEAVHGLLGLAAPRARVLAMVGAR
ncbi:MAG TPA: aminoglycoside phosphotransferase family protein [Kofleriaceae bacterium]|nr:aminoglycoside phosphotransferase family protein [Kofleriaceae bacterium]